MVDESTRSRGCTAVTGDYPDPPVRDHHSSRRGKGVTPQDPIYAIDALGANKHSDGSMLVSTLHAGDCLAGRYVLGGELGRGAASIVFEATDLATGQLV